MHPHTSFQSVPRNNCELRNVTRISVSPQTRTLGCLLQPIASLIVDDRNAVVASLVLNKRFIVVVSFLVSKRRDPLKLCFQAHTFPLNNSTCRGSWFQCHDPFSLPMSPLNIDRVFNIITRSNADCTSSKPTVSPPSNTPAWAVNVSSISGDSLLISRPTKSCSNVWSLGISFVYQGSNLVETKLFATGF